MRKQLIMCIGPEGMGHHMCQSIFEDIWKGKGKFDTQFPEIIAYWNNMIEDNINIFFNSIMMKVSNSPNDTFVFTPSSPYDNPRDSLRRPDILEFWKSFKKILDIRLLVLYRDPIEATYSLVKRGWCQTNDKRIKNHILYQAKIVEDNLIHTKAHLEAIGIDNWKTLHYESIIANPRKFAAPLCAYTNMSLSELKKGLRSVSKPHDRDDIPENYMQILNRFFSKSRVNMWEDFYLNNKL